jgi:hypothetical protein
MLSRRPHSTNSVAQYHYCVDYGIVVRRLLDMDHTEIVALLSGGFLIRTIQKCTIGRMLHIICDTSSYRKLLEGCELLI